MKRQTTPHPTTKRQEAQDPSTESARLLELARSSREDLRRLIAQNPNAPLAALSALAEQFPDEVLENPILPLLLLEGPQNLLQFRAASLCALLWSRGVSEMLLRIAATSKSDRVRRVVACCPKTPPDLLRSLSEAQDERVRWFVARHPATDADTLALLCGDSSPLVRVAALERCPAFSAALGPFRARWESLTLHAFSAELLAFRQDEFQQHVDLAQLYASGGALALSLVALSPRARPEWLEALAERALDSAAYLLSPLLSNPALPADLLERLAAAVSPERQELGLFFHPCPPEHLRRAWVEGSSSRLELLAGMPVAEWLLEGLSLERDRALWLSLLSAARLSSSQYQRCYEAFDFQLAFGLAQSPNTPPPLLRALLSDWRPSTHEQPSFDFAYEHMRAALQKAAAGNPSLPSDCFEALVRSAELSVRRAVFGNPNLPATYFALLLQEDDTQTQINCAKHPKLPAHFFASLAGSPSIQVRCHIAARHDLAPALAQRLSEGDELVQASLALNPQTPAWLLERLAAQGAERVRAAVARNDNTPPALLSWLSHDPAAKVLEKVAAHPNTPLPCLKRLSASPHELVRYQAFVNPSLDLSWLYEQRFDEEDYDTIPF